jgi:DNA invertase Pin-like site-specific DNA recombinase
MPSRVALYARVSTSEQHVEGQLHALRQYAQARGGEAVEYVDAGVSGARDRRPALDRLLADARRRRFDVLAITKLDRLARSVRHLTTLAAELEALGVGLVVLDQSIDTTTPAGRFLFNTLAAVAELERDLIRERTVCGLAAARRRGARLGRPKAIKGFAAWATVERRLAEGASLGAVAVEMGVSRSTISRHAAALRQAAASVAA